MTNPKKWLSRRKALKKTGAGAVGSTIVGSGLITSTGIASASTDDPYDDVPKEVIDDPNGNPFAEIHSAVTGPKTVEESIGSVNLAVALPISFDVNAGQTPQADVDISVEAVSTPGDYDLQDIVTSSQGDGGDNAAVLEYAIDAAWSASIGRALPIPNPWDLVPESTASVDQDFSESYIDANWPRQNEGGYGLRWEVDFYVEDGIIPKGDWDFRVTCNADVGVLSTSTLDPGFDKYGEITHTHDVTINVG